MSKTGDNTIDLDLLDRRLALSAEEAGVLLNVSPNAVRRLHEVKALRGFCVGKCLRWARADVVQYVETLRKRRD